jgi:hypothetical protein
MDTLDLLELMRDLLETVNSVTYAGVDRVEFDHRSDALFVQFDAMLSENDIADLTHKFTVEVNFSVDRSTDNTNMFITI